MEKFTAIKGIAAPLPENQIAAEALLPKEALLTLRRAGLGKFLFAAKRYQPDGREDPAFILNQPAWRKSAILVTGAHFGHGVSGDHLFWALIDFGIRAIVSPVFDGDFRAGCYRHGILPVQLEEPDTAALLQAAADKKLFTVDLEKKSVSVEGGAQYRFETPAFERHCLLSGLDAIGLTLEHEDAIDRFETQHRKEMFWLYA
jgi:3-isopropylmalate/(R)-2-methylmalate dehydratase small subunit